jgi:DNA-binding transcriptional ArsR family regulator
LDFLDEFESGILRKGYVDRTNGFEIQLIAQIRDYFLLSDQIFNRTVPESSSLAPVEKNIPKAPLSPEMAERLLTPLSNARRVQVMLILSRESSSLAELSRELDLKKGHLQFHLKALLEVDYIIFDRKSRLYSITPRGTFVMESVARVLDTLNDVVVE